MEIKETAQLHSALLPIHLLSKPATYILWIPRMFMDSIIKLFVPFFSQPDYILTKLLAEYLLIDLYSMQLLLSEINGDMKWK